MLDELRRLMEIATPGPWKVHDDRRKWVTSDDPAADWARNRDNDAALVVALRNVAPELLAIADLARIASNPADASVGEFALVALRNALARLD